jgi:hypothetical protein
MSRIVAPLSLLLTCGLALLAGCSWTRSDSGGIGKGGGTGGGAVVVGGGGAESLIPSLEAFTEELAGKVEAATDPRAGVAEAQKLLDARRGEMAGRIAAFKESPQARADAAARGKWLEAEVDNTERVHRLQVKFSEASTRDPEFKARLDKLVGDYDSMFKDR